MNSKNDKGVQSITSSSQQIRSCTNENFIIRSKKEFPENDYHLLLKGSTKSETEGLERDVQGTLLRFFLLHNLRDMRGK